MILLPHYKHTITTLLCCYTVLFNLLGALPPDLTFIVLAREHNEDYIFSYLMGYQDPPAGVEVPEGQYYNVYFQGQGTSMAPPLFNDMITYEDGMLLYMSSAVLIIVLLF